jgi:peptide/nickel transport system substrate-binding protein
MTMTIKRRSILQAAALGAAGASLPLGQLLAQARDSVTIAWPTDVPSWDPNQRTVPDAQPIYKLVFDQPIFQQPDLTFGPGLFKTWKLSDDGLAFEVEMRDDVTFHDGSKMTAEDFRYSFYERVQAKHAIDVANIWRRVTDIEVHSPTKATMRFGSPYPTAAPWLGFMASYIVPKAYMERVGVEGFREKPIGSGPYRLVEYQLNSRMVLERNDAYWGPKPELRRIIVNVVRDPAARAAAVESGQADVTVNVTVRDAERLARVPTLEAELVPITRLVLLQCRNTGVFNDENVRLAAHHAIDKTALSRAIYGGAAVPLSAPVTPGAPSFEPDFKFDFDVAKAQQLLARSGFNPQNPAKLKMFTTNGHFSGDFDVARAIAQMWRRVGIEAEVEVIEYAKYFELNRGNQLPEVTVYSWDNATGDPEIYAGYMLNPNLPFSAWKEEEIGKMVTALFATTDFAKRIEGYKALQRHAVNKGATIPLLQSIITVARRKPLQMTKYGNGWVLGSTMKWG